MRNSDDKAREILLESVCTLMRKLQEKGLKMSDLSQKETMMNSSVENRLNKRVGAFGDLVLMILLCTVCDYKNLQKTLHDHNQRMLRQQQKVNIYIYIYIYTFTVLFMLYICTKGGRAAENSCSIKI